MTQMILMDRKNDEIFPAKPQNTCSLFGKPMAACLGIICEIGFHSRNL
jgi:hypothetical protein